MTWQSRRVKLVSNGLRRTFTTLSLLIGVGAGLVSSGQMTGASQGPDAPDAAFPTACPSGESLVSGGIATIAGNGSPGHSGDGGPATEAAISPGFGTIGFDADGAIYFAEIDFRDVRRVGSDGIITTLAGPATGAPFVAPAGVAVDADGNVLVADYAAGRIWSIDPSTEISSI